MSWRRGVFGVMVAVALTMSSVAVPGLSSAAVPEAKTEVLGPIAFVGDSVSAGLTTDLRARITSAGFTPVTIDAAVYRRMTRESRSVGSGLSTIRSLRSGGVESNNWVIALGTNDFYESPAVMERMIGEVVDEVGANRRVIWVNIWMRSNPQASEQFNAALARVAARREELVILDWASLASSQPAWFATDGIHHTAEGHRQRNEFIADGVQRVQHPSEPRPQPAAPIVLTPVGPLLAYTPIAPVRVLDSRQAGSTSFAANEIRRIDVASVLPADAQAAILNVTAIGNGSNGFVTAWDCAAAVPPTSSLNYPSHAPRAASAVVTLDTGRGLCVKPSSASDVIVDVMGGWTESGTTGVVRSAARVFDTRELTGGQRLEPNRVVRIPIPAVNSGVMPVAALVNITASNASAAGFVTAWPCGGAVPTVSVLNFEMAKDMANAAWVPTDGTGAICAVTSAATHLIVDLAAVVDTALAGARYQAVVPTRVIDTRSGLGGHTETYAGVRIGRSYGLMVLTVGLLETVTVTQASGPGYVTVGPCAGVLPPVSTVNFGDGDVANSAMVRFTSATSDCHVLSAPADLVVDVVGHFQAYLVGA